VRGVHPWKGVKVALASAAGGILLAPAGLFAAGEQPRMSPSAALPPPPAAQLVVRTENPTAGAPVELDASGSTGSLAAYRWDLDGDGAFEAPGAATASTNFEPGTRQVGVQVVDEAGRADEASVAVEVAGTADPDPDPDPTPTTAAPSAEPEPDPEPEPKQRQRTQRKEATVRAAASQSVAIENFLFAPATVNVDVGDSVTWTNRDEEPHTATGNGGSFNTGTLDQNQSGSHTFTRAGRFPYICALHPSMKGTVVVAGGSSGGSSGGDDGSASGSGAGDSGAGDTATAPGVTGGAGSGSSLPSTGLQLLAVVLVGMALTASGAGLRRLLAPQSATGRAGSHV
jgi:plastocyanin